MSYLCSMTRAPSRRLADVAKKVGVSEATVSRVLNGKAGVSGSTREAVLTALDVLGYERPTQLRGERARLIGLVLPELQNPIFPALAEVVGGGPAQRGFTPVLRVRGASGGVEPATSDAARPAYQDGVHAAGTSPRRTPARPLAAAGTGRAGRAGQRRRRAPALPRVSVDDAAAVEQALGQSPWATAGSA
jgi:DNA-binding LacI/PurR family transcriptional regulator